MCINACHHSEAHTPFPWYEIILIQQYGFWDHITAGRSDAIIKDLLPHLFDGLLPIDHRTAIDVYDIPHAFGEGAIG